MKENGGDLNGKRRRRFLIDNRNFEKNYGSRAEIVILLLLRMDCKRNICPPSTVIVFCNGLSERKEVLRLSSYPPHSKVASMHSTIVKEVVRLSSCPPHSKVASMHSSSCPPHSKVASIHSLSLSYHFALSIIK